MVTQERILEALKDVKDPELNKSLVELNMVRDIQVDKDNNVSLTVVLTIAGCPLRTTIEQDVIDKLKEIGAKEVNVTFGAMTDEELGSLISAIAQ